MASKIQIADSFGVAERIALDKIKGDKNGVEAGDHKVDFCVRVSGTIRKGEDFEQTPSFKIPLMSAMAICLRRMGFQRENAVKLLVESMQAAIDGETDMHIDEAVAEAKKMLQAKLAEGLPKQKMDGKVTVVDLSVEKMIVSTAVIATRAASTS